MAHRPRFRGRLIAIRLAILGACLLAHGAAANGQTPPASPERPRFESQHDDPAPLPRELVRLEYAAAPGCPGEQALRTTLASRLGYDPVSPRAQRLLRVVIAREGLGFVARAELRDAAGTVTWTRPPISDADCRALVDVMGLSLKFAIDPASSAARPITPAPVPIVVLSPPPAEPPRVEQHAAPPLARPKIRLGARVAAAIATAPATTATVTVDAGVGWTYFSITGEARADLPVTGGVDYGIQARTRIAAGSLVPCGHYRWFVGCAVLSVGELQVEGVSTHHPAVGTAVYAAVGPRVGLEWPLPPLPAVALRLSGDLLVTVHPVTALVDAMHVWSAPAFAGLVGGGFVVKF